MTITARKLKDGKTVYDAELFYGINADGTRDRSKRTFDTRKDAEAAVRDAARFRNAVKNRTGRLTVEEYIDRWYWPIASRRLEATSLDTYRREIDKRILPHLGGTMLCDIDRMAVQRMVDACSTESVGRKALGTLKTILNEAVGDGFLDANPATARYALPKRGERRDNGLILGDFGKIREFIEEVQNDALEPITRLVMAGLTLGLRPEERYALDTEDVDVGNAVVHVRGAYVTASAARGGNQMKRTKTAHSERDVPMPRLFLNWALLDVDDHVGAWIRNRDGGRLSPSTGRKMWTRYLDAHPHLPRITLENMRHSFATACLAEGMNVENVSRLLGHSDINTTYRRYVRPDMDNLRRDVELVRGYADSTWD